MKAHTCNGINPTTTEECLACAVERGECTEAIYNQPETRCRQPLDHDGPHDFDVDHLDADHLHVILDALQFAAAQNIPEHFSASYDDPHPSDPKGTPEGWERIRADAERIVGDLLGHAPRI